jgi:hypothetical protein
VIYASRWGASVREDLHHVAHAIVERSAQNNRQIDVTGLLLVHGGWFVQALEGPSAAVRAVFARIAADPRHFDVTVLASGSAGERLFRDHAMAERRLSPLDDGLLERLGLDEKFAPAQLDAERALILMSVAGQMADAA